MFNFKRKIEYPEPVWLEWLRQDCQYSPDLYKLEQYKYQLLFCCDETQTDMAEHCLVENSAKLTSGYTRDDFNFWRHKPEAGKQIIPMRATPGAPASNLFPPPLKIRGEILAVETNQFKTLDTARRNTVQFLRQRVQVIVPYRKVMNLPVPECHLDDYGNTLPMPLQLLGKQGVVTPETTVLIRAWMYVGIPDYWDPLLDAGFAFTKVTHYPSRRPWMPEYYHYNNFNKNR